MGYSCPGVPKLTDNNGKRRRNRSPRAILRWLGRFLWWSLVTVAVTVLLVAIVALFAYWNRVRLVNDALALLAAPYQVTVEEIHIRELGLARIEGLTLSPKESVEGDPTLRVPEVEITYDFATLRNTRQLKTLTLKKPEILVDERLYPKAENPRPPSEKFDLSSLAYFTDSVIVEDGSVHVKLEAFPEVTGKWEFNSKDLSFAEDGMLERPFSATLEDVHIGGAESGNSIEKAEISVSTNRDLTRFDISRFSITRPKLTITPDWLESMGGEKTETEPDSAPPTPLPDLHFGLVEVVDADLSLRSFNQVPDVPSIPDLGFLTDLHWEDISFENSRWSSAAPLDWTAREVTLGRGETQFLSANQIEVHLQSLTQLIHDFELENVIVDTPEVILSDASMTTFHAPPEEASAKADSAATETPGKPFTVVKASVKNGRFLMQDFTAGGNPTPRIQAAVEGTLEDLHLGGGQGFDSDGDQAVLLRQFKLWTPGSKGAVPILGFDEAELTVNWSDFDFDNTVERLSIRHPEIHFTDESLGDWLNPEPSDTSAPGPVNRPVYKVRDLSVTDGSLLADSKFSNARVPKIVSKFQASTREDPDDPFSYLFTLTDVAVRNHAVEFEAPDAPADPTLFPDTPPSPGNPIAESDVITVREIGLTATAEQLQRTRRIGSITLNGAVLKVGDGLKSIVDSNSGSEGEETPTLEQEGEDLPTWTIDKVQVTQSQVRFEALVPQVEGLEFGIETTLEDVPLSLDGLLAQDQLQKVELAGIEIKDPYNSFITVAFLPTIFVEFSLAGLARQEVEKIDLINPSLYVGQGLFWWIDYQRKFREQNEGASVGLDSESETDNSPDWVIKTINATAGKIVIAPTGVPIGMVPFPFNATTNMEDGRIELKLNIPDEEYVYRFPDYKVNLYGLTGDIQFNVPVEQVNNNLVQTFSLDKAVWKDYEAENLYLSVTFDADGVYGQFGGEAYGGYAEGQFNVYLNDKGKWDAWIAGTNMDTGGITQVIAPENFKMEGDVSLKLISEGRGKELGETTGEFQTVTPGWFDVTKLDAILDNLPEEWSNLQRALTELGLIALKRFDYDKGAGSLYLHGQEGDLELRFTGPYGVRELNLFLHDQRNNTELTKSQ